MSIIYRVVRDAGSNVFTVLALDGNFEVGKLNVSRATVYDRKVAQVWGIEVDRRHRRRGIATGLYETAARFACETWGLPLASDKNRSYNADRFWRKQYTKGRAEGIGDTGGKARAFRYYVLKCPAPASLGAFTGWRSR